MNDGVSLNISMILAVAFDGFLGAGPPPVFLCSFLKSENSSFAVDRGQIFPFIPNFLDSAVRHPNSIYRLCYLQPRNVLLCVSDVIGKFGPN